MIVILTDNSGAIHDVANVPGQQSLDELNRIAKEATAGNCWWEEQALNGYTPLRLCDSGAVETAPICNMDFLSARDYAIKAFGAEAAVAKDPEGGFIPTEADVVWSHYAFGAAGEAEDAVRVGNDPLDAQEVSFEHPGALSNLPHDA